MKKFIKSMFIMLCSMMMVSSLVACGSDDDEDGGGGSGSSYATLTIDGNNYSVKYAFYIPGEGSNDGSLMFSNINLMGGNLSNSTMWTYCVISFPNISADNIPVGEFNQADIEAFVNQPLSGEEPEIGFGGYCNVKVSKSNDTYTIDVETTNITDIGGTKNASINNAKLHFQGKVQDSSSLWRD